MLLPPVDFPKNRLIVQGEHAFSSFVDALVLICDALARQNGVLPFLNPNRALALASTLARADEGACRGDPLP